MILLSVALIIFSVLIISPEKDIKKKWILRIFQLMIFIIIWQIGSYTYITKLKMIDNELYVIGPVLLVVIFARLINTNIIGIKDDVP